MVKFQINIKDQITKSNIAVKVILTNNQGGTVSLELLNCHLRLFENCIFEKWHFS